MLNFDRLIQIRYFTEYLAITLIKTYTTNNKPKQWITGLKKTPWVK